MKTSNTVKRACNLALRRIRLERAGLRLDEHYMGNDEDTRRVREATRSYFDTWLEPIIIALRDGDTKELAFWTNGENCTDPDEPAEVRTFHANGKLATLRQACGARYEWDESGNLINERSNE